MSSVLEWIELTIDARVTFHEKVCSTGLEPTSIGKIHILKNILKLYANVNSMVIDFAELIII